MDATHREPDPLPTLSHGTLPPLGYFGGHYGCKMVLDHLNYHLGHEMRYEEDVMASVGGFVMTSDEPFQLTTLYAKLCDIYEKTNEKDVEKFGKYVPPTLPPNVLNREVVEEGEGNIEKLI